MYYSHVVRAWTRSVNLYLTMTLAVVQYRAIRFDAPLVSRQNSRMNVVCIFIIILMLVINLFIALEYKFQIVSYHIDSAGTGVFKDECRAIIDNSETSEVTILRHHFVLPTALIVICLVLILCRLRQISRRRQRLVAATSASQRRQLRRMRRRAW